MLLIYQIGDMPLFFDLRCEADDSISVKSGRDWRTPSVEFSGVSGSTFVGDPYKPVAEAQKLDISGTFICDEGVSSERLFRHIHSLGGIAQMPVVALRYEQCNHVDSISCCSKCNPTLDWIVNYGIITGIKSSSDYFNTKKPYSTGLADITITMQMGSKWKQLSKYEWDYRIGKSQNPFTPTQVASTPFLPETFAGLFRDRFFFKLDTTLSRYDPTYWGIKYADSYGGIGSDYGDVGTFVMVSDPETWSAPPNSVYAFTNLLNLEESLSISVRRSRGLFDTSERIEESTLDLGTLNTDLLNGGYGGLYASDTIITGFANPFPGFVLRDTVVLDVRPRWIYPGLYPGETSIGYNQITVAAAGNPAKFAFLHDFGMY